MIRWFVVAQLALGIVTAMPASAAPVARDIAAEDSFRIGDAGVLCTAQVRPFDKMLKGMFDRGYSIACRDAAAVVGNLYALRGMSNLAVAAVIAAHPETLSCQPAVPATIEGLGPVTLTECVSPTSQLSYRAYSVQRGNTIFIAEGLGGYDSAIRLGLVTLYGDRPAKGVVEVATTTAGNPAALARVQAGTLDPDSALTQAYLRNNSGSFAEAAEFFETLVERDTARPDAARSTEYLLNQGLQQSNLGNFAAADQLFAQAANLGATSDAVISRLLRNYRAMDELNQRKADEAIAILATPVPPLDALMSDQAIAGGVISPNLSEQINRQNAALERLGGVDKRLRPFERAQILDGQSQQLRGVAYRLLENYPEAVRSLDQASLTFARVREGRVASTAFLRSENFAELALIDEAQQNYTAAEKKLSEASRILNVEYPNSAAGLAAKARLASYLARRGDVDRSLAIYGEVVVESEHMPGSAAGMRNLLAPYFRLLAQRANTDSKAAEAMFAASQIMVRPGVAQTQAVFARELSSGDDEASSLFRQSVTLGREVSRMTGEVARLATPEQGAAAPSPEDVATARATLLALEREQTELQSRLGTYPRYRVLAPAAMKVGELQQALHADEAYYQLRLIGQDAYAVFVTAQGVRAARLATTADQLSADVARLRSSIVTIENGRTVTYPFDLALARKLYLQLFGPFNAEVIKAKNLIFEPDGPMLQLPPNLLVIEQAGVDDYDRRIKGPKADEYDYRGIAWLGRDRDVTTAVSPRSFVDIRMIPPSKGRYAYLGLGHNAPPSAKLRLLRLPSRDSSIDCEWPMSAWENPISASELELADKSLGGGRAQLITGAAFTDTALKARTDLDQYRVLHFATHGLVTAPNPRCPARPALLTSFGDQQSDGLLTFREIYDLKLDADAVVLSACDTAGMATIEATRDAGVATGGNFALDGLVRAFVGAGARSVIASHWPIPDDYDATKKLMVALFSAPPGTPIADALRDGQRKLMASADTSHPFYWAAFAIVGDGQQPLIRK